MFQNCVSQSSLDPRDPLTSSPSITRFSSSFRPSSQRLSTRRLPSGYRERRGSSAIACARPRVPPRSAIAEGPRGAVHGGARLAEVVVYDLVWRLIPRTRIYAVCTSSRGQRTTTPFFPECSAASSSSFRVRDSSRLVDLGDFASPFEFAAIRPGDPLVLLRATSQRLRFPAPPGAPPSFR